MDLESSNDIIQDDADADTLTNWNLSALKWSSSVEQFKAIKTMTSFGTKDL